MIDIRRATVQDTQSISHLGATTLMKLLGIYLFNGMILIHILQIRLLKKKYFAVYKKKRMCIG